MSDVPESIVLSGCRRMLKHAISENKSLSSDLLRKIGMVDTRLKTAGLAPLSPVEPVLIGDAPKPAPKAEAVLAPAVPPAPVVPAAPADPAPVVPPPAVPLPAIPPPAAVPAMAAPLGGVPVGPVIGVGAAAGPAPGNGVGLGATYLMNLLATPPADPATLDTSTLLAEIHAALADLIKPVTSVSLLATEREMGKRGAIQWPFIVWFAVWAAILGIGGFAVTSALWCGPETEDIAGLREAGTTIQKVAASVFNDAEVASKARPDTEKNKDTAYPAAKKAKEAADEAARAAGAIADGADQRQAVDKLRAAIDLTKSAADEAEKSGIKLATETQEARPKLPGLKTQLVMVEVKSATKFRYCDYLKAMFAAALGAAFYILLRCYTFLVERSFDPSFNFVYLLRFFLGVIAGMVLSIIADPKWGQPSTLALIGGFLGEGVQLIIQRLIDTLLTLVRGDGSSEAQAKLREQQLKIREKLLAIPATEVTKKPLEEALAVLK